MMMKRIDLVSAYYTYFSDDERNAILDIFQDDAFLCFETQQA